MDKDKKEPFSAPRWNDIPVPTVTGHVTFFRRGKEMNPEKVRRTD